MGVVGVGECRMWEWRRGRLERVVGGGWCGGWGGEEEGVVEGYVRSRSGKEGEEGEDRRRVGEGMVGNDGGRVGRRGGGMW